MVTTLPILSDIVSDVVDRINAVTTADADPFEVKFAFGPMQEVSKSVYNYDPETVVVWLVEKGEDRRRQDIYGVSGNDIIIGLQSNDQWSMAERMTNNYKPKLLPVYELLVQELKKERQLNNPYKIDHKKYNLYYWGGGAVNGTNSTNLWEKMIDAILLENCVLGIRNKC
jgi:hypothetical protein